MSNSCDCSGSITMLPVKGFGVAVDTDSLPKTDLSSIEERLDALEKATNTYFLCEFYSFRNPQKKKGFELAHGELLEKASELYPEAWAFLQTDEGKALCVTEEEWQAMNHAVYYTATSTDETGAEVKQEFSFDGIGGAPFYVQNLCDGTLRLPDIRGMYAEASGFDGLIAGGVHGDMVRSITGSVLAMSKNIACSLFHSDGEATGALVRGRQYGVGAAGGKLPGYTLDFDASRVVPTGNANKPRAFGVLPCVYLGNSKQPSLYFM